MKTYYDHLQLQKDMESCLFVREKTDTPEYIKVEITFLELTENALRYPVRCKFLLTKVDSDIIDLSIGKLKEIMEYRQPFSTSFCGYIAVSLA